MTTATMLAVDGGEMAAVAGHSSVADAGVDDLLGSICELTGAMSGILHRASAGPLACQSVYPAGQEDQLEALRQIVMLRSRSGGRPAAPGRRDIVALPLGTRAFGDLWLALGFEETDDESPARVTAVEPALRLMIANHVDALYDALAATQREAALTAALNQSECGIIALCSDHTVLFTNTAADDILADRDGIELRRNVPRPTNYHSAVRFQEALDCVLSPLHHHARPGPRAMMLMLERERHKRPLMAVLSPTRLDGCSGSEAAVVYVMRPERSVGRGLDTICQLHGLSPVETHLVGHLMAGLTVAEAATAMRVKPDTARAYLKQVFVKTDTHRQSELLQLLLRYQRAVRGDFTFCAA